MTDRVTEERRTLKPGWKTTEFYVSIVGGILPWIVPALPPTWQAALSTAAAAVYAVARGMAKRGIGQ